MAGSRLKSFLFSASLAVVLLGALVPQPARAWDGHYYGGYHRGYDRFHHYYPGHARNSLIIDFGPPVVTQYVDLYPPPVYAAPRPVIYEERQLIGTPPLHVNPVPVGIMRQLRPAPYGYFYCMGDGGDVYMVSQADNTIVQVISVVVR